MKTLTLYLGGLLLLLTLAPVYFAAPAPAPEVPKLRATLGGYKQGIRWIVLSPDGKILASACIDGTIKLWSVADGKEITTFSAHPGEVIDLVFSPDSKFLASNDGHQSIKLWRIADDKCELAGTFQCPCGQMLFSPDGKTIASTGPSGIRLLTLETKEVRHVLKSREGIPTDGMHYTPEGKLLAVVADRHGGADLYDVLEGKVLVTLKDHLGGSPRGMAFSADGKTVVTADAATIRLWEVATGKPKVTLKIEDLKVDNRAGCFAFNPKGTLVAAGCPQRDNRTGSIALFEAATGKVLTVLKNGPISLNLVFSPDGKTLASCNSDQTITLWSIPEAIKAEK